MLISLFPDWPLLITLVLVFSGEHKNVREIDDGLELLLRKQPSRYDLSFVSFPKTF